MCVNMFRCGKRKGKEIVQSVNSGYFKALKIKK